MTLAFAPFDWHWAAWLFAPMLAALLWWQPLTRRAAFSTGWVAGLAFFGTNLSWLRNSSRVLFGAQGNEWMGFGVEALGAGAVLGMSLVLACYFGLWAMLCGTLLRPRAERLSAGVAGSCGEALRCAGTAAAAWVALEWLRGWVLTGFGWNGLGVAMHDNAALIQAAELVGVAGLSFTLVFSPLMIAIAVWKFRLRLGQGPRWNPDVALAVSLITVQLLYGIQKLAAPLAQSSPVKVALAQQNVPQQHIFAREHVLEHYQRYVDLTRTFASDADLVVWPESAVMLPYEHAEHAAFFDPFLKDLRGSLLTGCDSGQGTGAVMVRGSWAQVRPYSKVHLVPFGEYLPLRSVPGVEAVLGGLLPGDFDPGTVTEPLPIEGTAAQAIPLVCFEDTDGDLARRFIRPHPQVLINLTNDGWFLQSAEPEQHLANAIFRCVELRRPMARACNTGVTCFIDARGQIVSDLRDRATGSTFIEGVLPGSMTATSEITLYARWGDWFAKVCALWVLAVIARSWLRARQSAVTESAP